VVLGVFGEIAEAGGLADAILNVDLGLVEFLSLFFESHFLVSTDKRHDTGSCSTAIDQKTLQFASLQNRTTARGGAVVNFLGFNHITTGRVGNAFSCRLKESSSGSVRGAH
jgi:hypothetical protein